MKGVLFITHTTETYDYYDSAEIALKGGCRQIQLRMKENSVEDVERVALRVKQLCEGYGARLYINDHVEVCKNVKAHGVHLGKQDISPGKAREILGWGFTIGGTANTFADICRLKEAGVDYVGLGPFRFTNTKKKLSPVLGLDGYQEIMEQCRKNSIHLPVLAIGGITSEDIPVLMETGVCGIALSSAILQAKDPVYEMQRINNIIETYR